MVCIWQLKWVHQYELVDKGLGQIYLWLVMLTPFSFFFIEVVYIFWHSGCLWREDNKDGLDCWYDFGVKVQGQIYLISIYRLITWIFTAVVGGVHIRQNGCQWWEDGTEGLFICGLEVKGEGQIYVRLDYVYVWLELQTLFTILDWCVHGIYNDRLWGVDDNKCFGSPIWPWSGMSRSPLRLYRL